MRPVTSTRELAALSFRAVLGIVGVAALAFAGLWAYEAMDVFDPNFNPKGAPAGYQKRDLVILGALGVVAALVTGGSALAYAKTATRRFLAGVAVGGLCGVLLFVVWIDLYEVAGGYD